MRLQLKYCGGSFYSVIGVARVIRQPPDTNA